MSTQVDLNNKNNNIIVGPDYEKMANANGNTVVLNYLIPYILPRNKKQSIFMIIFNVSCILLLKTVLDNSKNYLDNFKFTNVDYLRYLYQKFNYSENVYDFVLVSNKWLYNDVTISLSTFTPFLEKKSISINNPNTYYYSYHSFLIKVVVTQTKISFHTPKINSISTYMNDVIRENKEILLGNRTVMHKIIVTDRDVNQISPLKPSYTFETDNYKKLYTNLTQFFELNDELKMKQTPLVYAFNGPIGTGKTSFGSFIAEKGIVDKIVLYNMVQQCSKDFKSIINDLNTTLTRNNNSDPTKVTENERVLLMLDEIDTYAESYIAKTIDNLRLESRKKTETKSGSGQQTSETNINSFEKMSAEDEKDKRILLKEEFLNTLYNLCEGLCLKDNKQYIIICNTNNFDGMFEGCSEGYNYIKTKDRFQRYEYRNLDKQGIVDFLNGIKETILAKQLCNKETVEYDSSIYDIIDENYSISFRNLSKLLLDNNYNIVKTIKCLSVQNNNSNLMLDLNVI